MSGDDLAAVKIGLRELRLGHAADILEEEIARATKSRSSYTALIARLVETERERRRERAYARRLKAAGFPETKTLDEYVFTFPKKVDVRLVKELGTLGFLRAKESIWISGPTGTGKTHIACSIGLRAVQEGHTAIYAQLGVIARDLNASIADHTEERRLRFYERIDLLVVEDLGFAAIPTDTMPLLFELFNRRYGRRSTMVTSNLDANAVEKSLRSQAMAGAILDRILHHAHLVSIDGPSFRAEHRLAARSAAR